MPARNEAGNLRPTVDALVVALVDADIPYELIIVDDNSEDHSGAVIESLMGVYSNISAVTRAAPSGFGRAVRAGLDKVSGDVVIIHSMDRISRPIFSIVLLRLASATIVWCPCHCIMNYSGEYLALVQFRMTVNLI